MNLIKFFIPPLFFLFCITSYAEPGDIDAGQIINQIEKNDPIRVEPVIPQIEEKQEQAPSASDFTVNLKNINFTGNQSLDQTTLENFKRRRSDRIVADGRVIPS